MGRIIPHIMENKKCLKPPTSSAVACWKRPTLPEGCWIHRDTLCFFASGNMRPWKLSKEKEQVMSTVGILGFINPWLCSLGPSHFSSRLWMFVEKPTKLIYPEFMNPGLTLLNSRNHWLSDLTSLDLSRKHDCFTSLILNPWCEGLPSNGIG